METSPRPCNFGISAKDDYGGMLPDGFHVKGRNRCPRNLSPDEAELVDPSGKRPCPLYNEEECARAFFEEYQCPTRGEKRGKRVGRLF